MPIDPALRRALYNKREWKEARERVRARAGYQCECRGQCGKLHVGGRCDVKHTRHKPCTVAHVDHNSGELVPDCKLALFCSVCHLRYDVEQHLATRRRKIREQLERRGQVRLL